MSSPYKPHQYHHWTIRNVSVVSVSIINLHIIDIGIIIVIIIHFSVERKFGSQTSDNMDTWKSRGGKSQRRERQKKADQRRERKKQDQGAQKGRKAPNTVFFQCFVRIEK